MFNSPVLCFLSVVNVILSVCFFFLFFPSSFFSSLWSMRGRGGGGEGANEPKEANKASE